MSASTTHDQALVVCRDTIAHHSKSFALASRLLPTRSRDDAAILYTWCRRADDAIDLAPRAAHKRELAQLRAELDSVYAGERQRDMVLDAFQQVIQRHAIPREYPAELLAGMEMDVEDTVYTDMDTLRQYCFRVASTVGLMMSHVIGVSRDQAMRNAAHMGMGMQLTNICRDVLEDWNIGRLYVPDQLLASHGIGDLREKIGQPFPDQAVPAMARAIDDLLEHADRHYRLGDAGLPALPWRAAFAVRSARLVYSAIGGRVRRAGCDVNAGRAHVPGWHKLLLVSRSAMTSLAKLPIRWFDALRSRGSVYRYPTTRIEYPDDLVCA